MFVCGKGGLHKSNENKRPVTKVSHLKRELRKLKRYDIIHVLDEQSKGKGIRRVLELHGRKYMQIRINRADATSDNQLTLKICFNTIEGVRKYQKLLVAAIQFTDDIILFHSLDKHFKTVQTIISDTTSTKVLIYEQLGRTFEVNKEMTVHHVENVAESLIQELHQDNTFKLELLRFTNCHLKEAHIYAMQELITHVEKLDLTGNEMMPPKALHILSNDLLKSQVQHITLLNLSSCNLTDNHLVDLQPALYMIEELDLSYNEEITPLSMKILTSSIHVANLTTSTKHCLKKLILAGCNLNEQHIKQLYNCINSLECLDLSGNILLTAESMKVIAVAITETDIDNGRLQTLRLENCGITAHHLEMLAACIPMLKVLDLSWNVLSVECLQIIGISTLAMACQGDSQLCLRQLNLNGCELTDEHLSEIKYCIVCLQELYIGYNKEITSQSLQMISNQMNETNLHGKQCCLSVLDISGTAVDGDAVKNLLSNSREILTNLDLSLCKLSDDHIDKIKDCFYFLHELHLCDNQTLTPDAVKVLAHTITSKQDDEMSLKFLDLKKCKLEDSHMMNLQPCIKYLKKLDISFNPLLTPNAMKMISNSIKSGNNESMLKELRIASCGFKDSHLVNLSGSFIRLERLDISANNCTYISLLAIKNEVIECKDNGNVMQLKELNVYQAFGLRDYHYRKLENDLKPFGVKVISVV